MIAAEPAIPLVLAAAALLAGGDDAGWLLVAAAAFVLVIRRWEGFATALPGGAAVAAGLAAEGARWHLVVGAISLVAGAVVVTRRRVPDAPLDAPRAAAAAAAAVFVIGAGWLPALDLEALEAYREGAVLAAAGAALAIAAGELAAAYRGRSGKMEDPAVVAGADADA